MVWFLGAKASLVNKMRWVCSSLIFFSNINGGRFFGPDRVGGQRERGVSIRGAAAISSLRGRILVQQRRDFCSGVSVILTARGPPVQQRVELACWGD